MKIRTKDQLLKHADDEKRRRSEAVTNGICYKCFVAAPEQGKKTCSDCAEKWRALKAKYRARMTEEERQHEAEKRRAYLAETPQARERMSQLAAERRGRLINAGLCVVCGSNIARPDAQQCNNCFNQVRDSRQKWVAKNLDSYRGKGPLRQQRLYQFAITELGGACVCCGERQTAFLTIDHINGDGKEKRALHGPVREEIAFYLRNQQPLEGLQLLCWNCHMAKDYRKGCPHRR